MAAGKQKSFHWWLQTGIQIWLKSEKDEELILCQDCPSEETRGQKPLDRHLLNYLSREGGIFFGYQKSGLHPPVLSQERRLGWPRANRIPHAPGTQL
uniref:Uncharacterized protein n=1 Tax=Sphaerodactylus townsendi TaxID=933632 RepID=A0ACB8FKI5_9SAUR